MYKNYRILCTVCARGGSKGIPGKNKTIVAGRPLITYSLDVAKECDYIDDIIVSTDDDEIMKIASDNGISAPFKRPDNLSKDDSSKIDVIRHAVEWAEKIWCKKYDIIVDLSVVSPLRTIEDIKNSIELLVNENADNVFSVSPSYRNPYYNMVEAIDEKIKLVKEPINKTSRRQDAPVVFDMNDSIYLWQRRVLFEKDTVFNENTKIYIMPRFRSVDIDESFDLLVASLIIENWEEVYFNLGYKDYWQKRVTTNNPQNDTSATEEIFHHFFNKASSYAEQGSKLLDVGCGFGRFIPIYAASGRFKIYGIDISKESIDVAKVTYGSYVKELKVCSAENIEYGNNYFDMIILWAVLDAVKQDKAIYEALRVLNKNGIAIMTGKNDNYCDDDKNALIAEARAREKGHPNYFTNYDLMEKYISENGGKIIDNFFFKRRGDFGNLIYDVMKPEKFYEWCIIVEKVNATSEGKSQFYGPFSETFKRNK